MTFGDIREVMASGGLGAYRFPVGSVPVCDSAIARYTPAEVRSFIDDRTGEKVAGDVSLRFSGYVDTVRDSRSVTFSLADGANASLLSDCDKNRPTNPCGATPIASINGVSPDSKNRIVLWFH